MKKEDFKTQTAKTVDQIKDMKVDEVKKVELHSYISLVRVCISNYAKKEGKKFQTKTKGSDFYVVRTK